MFINKYISTKYEFMYVNMSNHESIIITQFNIETLKGFIIT